MDAQEVDYFLARPRRIDFKLGEVATFRLNEVVRAADLCLVCLCTLLPFGEASFDEIPRFLPAETAATLPVSSSTPTVYASSPISIASGSENCTFFLTFTCLCCAGELTSTPLAAVLLPLRAGVDCEVGDFLRDARRFRLLGGDLITVEMFGLAVRTPLLCWSVESDSDEEFEAPRGVGPVLRLQTFFDRAFKGRSPESLSFPSFSDWGLSEGTEESSVGCCEDNMLFVPLADFDLGPRAPPILTDSCRTLLLTLGDNCSTTEDN